VVVQVCFRFFDISIHAGHIRGQRPKLSEIAPNFLCFCPPKFLGCWPPYNWYPNYHACLVARHVGKFGGITPPGPKVIGAGMLNFKPFFEFLLKKIVGATPVPGGVCTNGPWSFPSTCKNVSRQRPLGTEIWFSEKSRFGWVTIVIVICKQTELYVCYSFRYAHKG